jgi:hypothetical protein
MSERTRKIGDLAQNYSNQTIVEQGTRQKSDGSSKKSAPDDRQYRSFLSSRSLPTTNPLAVRYVRSLTDVFSSNEVDFMMLGSLLLHLLTQILPYEVID